MFINICLYFKHLFLNFQKIQKKIMYRPFKRPQSSISSKKLNQKFSGHKSACTRSTNKLPSLRQGLEQYQQAAKELNRQLDVVSILQIRNSSHKFLSCFGKPNYSALHQKAIKTKENSSHLNPHLKFKKHSEQRMSEKIRKVSRNIKKKESWALKPQKNQELQELQNMINSEGPLERIGENMQFEAKLTKLHIENIKKVVINHPITSPIGFCLRDKDKKFSANVLYKKKDTMPICVSLYAQFFDAKEDESSLKRNEYIQTLVNKMNKTYDPEIMYQMPLIKHIKRSENLEKYFEVLEGFNLPLHKKTIQYLDEILRRFFAKEQDTFHFTKKRMIADEIKKNYKWGNQIASFDYFLKFPFNKLNLKQFLFSKKQYVSSYRILYHGGYSKTIYESWKNYVSIGKNKLSKKLQKYDRLVQEINGWSQQFLQISFVQIQYLQLLNKPVKIEQFKRIQEEKIKETFGILKQIWIKGVLTLMIKDCYLMEQEHQYQYLLADFSKKMKKFLLYNKNFQKHYTEDQDFQLYKQFLNSLHKIKKIHSYHDFLKAKIEKGKKQFGQPQSKINKKNIQLYLNIQFAEIIRKSVTKVLELIRQNQKPLIKLSIIVDRQSLNFEESKEKIIESIKDICLDITKKTLRFYTISPIPFDNEQQIPYSQYGNIKIYRLKQYGKILENVEGGFVSRINKQVIKQLNEGYEFHLRYRYQQIHEKDIAISFQKIDDDYNRSEQLIKQFDKFMPFIKLTASNKFFIQNNGNQKQNYNEQQIYDHNMKRIKKFKKQVQRIRETKNVGIFQVNCREPLKLLKERMNEIQYMIDQRYLNKIHEKIHNIEQEIGAKKSLIHSFKIKANNVDQVYETYKTVQKQLKQVKKKTATLSNFVYFYIEREPRTVTITQRYLQLIEKRKELENQIKRLIKQLNQNQPNLYRQLQEQGLRIQKNLETFDEAISEFCQNYFDHSKIDKALFKILDIKNLINQFQDEVKFYEVAAEKFSYEGLEKVHFYNKLKEKISIIENFWIAFHEFYEEKKKQHSLLAQQIDLQKYKAILKKSEKYTKQFIGLDMFSWINKIQIQYQEKFLRDFQKHKRYIPILEVLVNDKIQDSYFDDFQCSIFKGVFFRDLLAIEQFEEYLIKLQQMDKKVNCEYEIYDFFIKMKRNAEQLKIEVIDINGNDSLNEEEMKEILIQIYNYQIECQNLKKKQYSYRYREEIEEFQIMMMQCGKKIEEWLEVEIKFNEFSQFYCVNDDGPFKIDYINILDDHCRMMKSFDLDNSVWVLPKNQILSQLMDVIKVHLRQLQEKLCKRFDELRDIFPRYYLLSNSEMFLMMRSLDNMRKYLPKCLPSIQTISVKEKSIERLGGIEVEINNNHDNNFALRYKKLPQSKILGNHLLLKQPLQVGARLAYIHLWLPKLQSKIKGELERYLTSQQEEIPLQIILLKVQVSFSEALTCIQEYQGDEKLRYFQQLEQLTERNIEQLKKQINSLKDESVLLQHVLHRQLLIKLKETMMDNNSFEWLKIPVFKKCIQQNNQKTEIQIKVQFFLRQFQYGFNFLQKCQFTIQDHVLYGNCVIGQSQGKKTFIKHCAYLAGQELFVYYQEKNTDIYQILNYFKIVCTEGKWLLISHIQKMKKQALSLMAQCLISVEQAISEETGKICILNQAYTFTPSTSVFMTISKLHSDLPSRLLYTIRPVWFAKPNYKYLLDLYLECKLGKKAIKDSKLLPTSKLATNIMRSIPFPKITTRMIKTIDFFHYVNYHKTLPLWFFGVIRKFQFSGQTSQCQEQLLQRLMRTKLFTHSMLKIEVNPFTFETAKQKIVYSYQPLMCLWEPQKNKIHIYFPKDCVMLGLVKFVEKKVKKGRNMLVVKLREESLENVMKFCHFHFSHLNIDMTFLREMDKLEHPIDMKTRSQHNMQTLIQPSLSSQNQPATLMLVETLIENNKSKDLPVDGFLLELQAQYLSEQYSSTLFHLKQAFNNLMDSMLQKGYNRRVSVIFSAAWIYGSMVAQNHIYSLLKSFDILSQINIYVNQFEAVNLRNYYPVQNGFISDSQQLPHTNTIKLGRHSLAICSTILNNVILLQSLVKKSIVIESKQYLTTILKNLHSSNTIYVSHEQTPQEQQIISKLAKNTRKINHECWRYEQMKQIVIQDIERWEGRELQFLKNLVEEGEALIIKNDSVEKVKFQNCRFIVGCRVKIEPFLGSIYLKINQSDLDLVEKCFLSIFWKENLKMDYSEHSVFNIMNFLGKKYQQAPYYWFKYPALLTCNLMTMGKIKKLSQYFREFMNIVMGSLPLEENNILNHVYAYNNHHDSLNIIKSVNRLRTEEEHYLKKKICSALLNNSEEGIDHHSLRISQYVYQYIIKIARSILNTHTILLGELSTQGEDILKVTIQILEMKCLSYHHNIFKQLQQIAEGQKRVIILVSLSQITDQIFKDIQPIAKGQSPYSRKVILVLKMDIKSSAAEHFFEKYNFIKSCFITIVFPESILDNTNIYNSVDIQKTLLQLEKGDPYEKEKKIVTDSFEYQKFLNCLKWKYRRNRIFKIKFISKYKEMEGKQVVKYQFYRRLTEQLFDQSDMLKNQLELFPYKMENHIRNIAQITKQRKELQSQLSLNQNHLKSLSEDLNELILAYDFSKKQFDQNEEEIKKYTANLERKTEKVDKAIDNLTALEISKLKLQKKNDISDQFVILLQNILKQDIQGQKSIPISCLKKYFENIPHLEIHKDSITKIKSNLKRSDRKKLGKQGKAFQVVFDSIYLMDEILVISVQSKKIKIKNKELEDSINLLQAEIEERKKEKTIFQEEKQIKTKKLSQIKESQSLEKQNKKHLQIREEKIRQINHILNKEYKMKISQDLAEFFRELPDRCLISTGKELKLNEFDDDLHKQCRSRIKCMSESLDFPFSYMQDTSFNLFQNSQHLIKFKEEMKLDNVSIEQLSIVESILKSNNTIYVIQDQNNYIKNLITEICLETPEYCVVDIPNFPLHQLQKLINHRSYSYNKILVVGETLSASPFIIKHFTQAYQQVKRNSNKNPKLIFIYKQIRISDETLQMRNIVIAKVRISFKTWIRDFAEIMCGIKKLNQWEFYTHLSQYNNLMKRIFSGMERIKNEKKEKDYEIIIQTLQKLEILKSQTNKHKQKISTHRSYLSAILHASLPFYLLFFGLGLMEQRSLISLFERGNNLRNWLQVLQEVSNEEKCYKNHKIIQQQCIKQKIMVRISSHMNFNTQEQLLRYLCLCSFVSMTPRQSIDILIDCMLTVHHLQNDVQKIKHIIRKLLICQQEELEQRLQYLDFSGCEDWLQAYIWWQIGDFDDKELAIEKIKKWMDEEFYQKVYNRERSKRKHYFRRIKDNQYELVNRTHKKTIIETNALTPKIPQDDKILNILKIEGQNHHHILKEFEKNIQHFNMKTSIMTKIKFIHYHFNHSNKERSIQEIKELSKEKVYLRLVNVSLQEHSCVIDDILYEMSRFVGKNSWFRIIIVENSEYPSNFPKLINRLSFQEKIEEKYSSKQIQQVLEGIEENAMTPENMTIIHGIKKIVQKLGYKLCGEQHRNMVLLNLIDHFKNKYLFQTEGNCLLFLMEYFRVTSNKKQDFLTILELENILHYQRKQEPQSDNKKARKLLLSAIKLNIRASEILPIYSQFLNKQIMKKKVDRIQDDQIFTPEQLKKLIKGSEVTIRTVKQAKVILYEGINSLMNQIEDDTSWKEMGDVQIVIDDGYDNYLSFYFDEVKQMMEKQGKIEKKLEISVLKTTGDRLIIDQNQFQKILSHYVIRLDLSKHQNKQPSYLGCVTFRYK